MHCRFLVVGGFHNDYKATIFFEIKCLIITQSSKNATRYLIICFTGCNPSTNPVNKNGPTWWFHLAGASRVSATFSEPKFTISSITADLTVTALYEAFEYQISFWITGKGSVSPTEQSVAWGETVLFELLPEAGYTLYSVEGCGGQLVDELMYQTGEITENCELVVKFRDTTPRRSSVFMIIMATEAIE